MFKLSRRSQDKLQGVHPDLVKVIERAMAISLVDFMVVEGLRTKERQMQLVASGASKTMNSRHITGHAVDVAPMVGNEARWDWPMFDKLIPFVKQAADDCKVPIECGYDWVTFRDGPHIQLPFKDYP